MTATILTRSTIVARLIAGFAAMLLVAVIAGTVAIRSMTELSGLAGRLYDHPFTVTNAIMGVKAEILETERAMAAIVRASAPVEIDALAGEIAAAEADAQTHLALVRDRFLGSKDDVAQLSRALARWREARDETIALVRAGRAADAQAKYRDRDLPVLRATQKDLESIRSFAMAKAAEFRKTADKEGADAVREAIIALLVLVGLAMVMARVITRSIVGPLEQLRLCMTDLAQGNLAVEVPNREGTNEVAAMAQALEVFKNSALHLDSQRWVKEGVAKVSVAVQQADSVADFARIAVAELMPLLKAGIGVFYPWNEEHGRFELMGSYGYAERRSASTAFKAGEGLAGQCVLEKAPIVLDEVPADYVRISSGMGEAVPRVVLVAPVVSRGIVLAVLEIGSFRPFTAAERALIDEVLAAIAANLEILNRNLATRTLLEKTRQQAEELQVSEEELRAQSDALQAANEELRQKTQALEVQSEELRASEEELRVQHDALQAANEELQHKTDALEHRGRALEAAQIEANRRAMELDTASRYKSEFLANMSHELRTPLNSLLILAKVLADNEEGNLSTDQIESARIVYDSGSHLLKLINDILDLSKVEAGKMQVTATDIALETLATEIQRRFYPLAANKALALHIDLAADLPRNLHGDRGKLDQILNNLIGNAIKFTPRGKVFVRLYRPGPTRDLTLLGLDPQQTLAVSVNDTGIGIAPKDLDRVFRAFEQVDGSASREYGGTGLGLTISQKLAALMGGGIVAESEQGRGSTFTLYLPLVLSVTNAAAEAPAAPPPPAFVPAAAAPEPPPPPAGDAKDLILVIEDDPAFAKIVADLARKRGFKTQIASNGRMGLDLARQHRPTGIILDIGLPIIDGWTVMERLKADPKTRGIPIHVMSAAGDRERGLRMGAIGYDNKPATKDQINQAFERIAQISQAGLRRILVVDDDSRTRDAVAALLGRLNAEIVHAADGKTALERLKSEKLDCVVLDITLPGLNGFEILDHASGAGVKLPPVVVSTGRELSVEETMKLRAYTDSIIIKGEFSPERLLDEVTLFLHSVDGDPSGSARRILQAHDEREERLAGRTVLVVDDDMRNAFALSKALRAKGLKVLIAEDGYKALVQLKEGNGIDIVLMDIMMPGMDGYQTIQEIRKQQAFAALPIVALTAKAMIGDREKCLECGATDYMSKPVDIAQLTELMNTLLHREA
jgi:CheY-like chemotaxis protein